MADIKERLACLEDIISSDNSSSIWKTNDGSATVQLILSNTTLGWKLALRKLLQLKFGGKYAWKFLCCEKKRREV